MPRELATLPAGSRMTDYLSLGVLAKTFPLDRVEGILAATGTASVRQRALPAHVMVYYVIALALYMQVATREVLRCLLEGLQWLALPGPRVPVAAKSAIAQARARLGVEPLRRLYAETVGPIATPQTRGAWYRTWRLVSLDGSTLDLGDTAANARHFGRPGASRGTSAFPQVRFTALVENGTHVLFGAVPGPYPASEARLATQTLTALRPDMLCLADRLFFSYALWQQAAATGAALLWRAKENLVLPVQERRADGSYRSVIYPSPKARRRGQGGLPVRVIEYTLDPPAPAGPAVYRLLTTLLDPAAAPGEELAARYAERWEIETALDELKTHLRGAQRVLRSKAPALVLQEFYGLLLAHFAVRGLMHEAALPAGLDPDRLSFVHAVRVVRRTLPRFVALPPSGLADPPRRSVGGTAGRAGPGAPPPAYRARRETEDERVPPAAPHCTIAKTWRCPHDYGANT